MIGMENKTIKGEQLQIFEEKRDIKTCAFTGHRELGEDFSLVKLKKEIKTLIERGVETFYCGMAKGFDLLAAKCVLSLQKKYENVRIIACIPCPEQDKYYVEEDKKTYAKVLKKSVERVMVSYFYYKGCMQVRDRYMADRADVLLAYCKRETGGTAFTVRYFKKKYPLKEIVFL